MAGVTDPLEEKDFTEAELSGDDTPPAPPVTDPAAPPAPPKEPVVPPVVPPVPEKTAAEIPGKEPAAPPETPAPKKDDRVVPLAALKEERRARQELDRKVEELQRQLAANAEPRKSPAELILEDPENAMTVLMQEISNLRGEIARTNMERDINAAVPDFLDLAPQMEDLLLNEGLSEEGIRDLIAASGKDAPKFFKVLAKLTKAPNEATLREKLTGELTPAITATVTKELMAKFNIIGGDTNLGRLPGSGPDGKITVATEEDFAKLSPEMQEKYLRGEI